MRDDRGDVEADSMAVPMPVPVPVPVLVAVAVPVPVAVAVAVAVAEPWAKRLPTGDARGRAACFARFVRAEPMFPHRNRPG